MKAEVKAFKTVEAFLSSFIVAAFILALHLTISTSRA
jgi:hypothetical protein